MIEIPTLQHAATDHANLRIKKKDVTKNVRWDVQKLQDLLLKQTVPINNQSVNQHFMSVHDEVILEPPTHPIPPPKSIILTYLQDYAQSI